VRFLSCGFACSRALHILYQRGESGGAVSCIISDPKSRVLPSGGYWAETPLIKEPDPMYADVQASSKD